MSDEPLLPTDVFKPDEPCFIIAGGPSLAEMDLEPLTGRPMITVNHSYVLFPESTVHFSADGTWVERDGPKFDNIHKGRYRAFCRFQWKGDRTKGPLGMKVYDHDRIQANPKHRSYSDKGFCTQMNHLRGNNSGGMAVNLSYHLGARLVILLGFDMQMKGDQMHWYKESPRSILGNRSTFTNIFLPVMSSMAEPAKEAGMRIVNCTPGSALAAFDTGKLEDYL